MSVCTGHNIWRGIIRGILIAALLLTLPVMAAPVTTPDSFDPAVYLNFNEGGSNIALDVSGHGNTGTIHGGAYRIDNGGCVRALALNGNGSYISIPYTLQNHPASAITVSLWFYVNDTKPRPLVSTYHNGGGYRLAFDDGNDLFWTVSLGRSGDVSVVVPHERIAPGQWHHVTGTYNGETLKIFLDGILRSQVNATGEISYTDTNAVLVGANAGGAELPDESNPEYFTGGIDEVRIYNRSLSYGEVMDDRFQCTTNPGTVSLKVLNITAPAAPLSGTLSLGIGDTVTKELTFSGRGEEGVWHVFVPAGSQLTVRATDEYARVYPDEWYVELRDMDNRITRAVAFPATNNAPVTGTIPSGNATVLVHYFGGKDRFPSSVSVTFACTAAKLTPVSSLPKVILEYPIIVIYTASWATLIALVVVIVWGIHKRRAKKQ
ncbi:MAG TPA: LamG domain-containing protein [Methanoregula sp.]|nr:LamG domain-containing protein [Methanoregula sp.]